MQAPGFFTRTGEKLIKLPGEINGGEFYLDTLKDCEVYVLDHCSLLYIDDCENCHIYIGPVAGSCFIRTTSESTITLAAKQLRTKNCTNITVFTYSATTPSIELTKGMQLAPFNLAYPLLEQHFTASGLNPKSNNWSTVYDFNSPHGNSPNWGYLTVEEYYDESFEIPGLPPPTNPVIRDQDFFAYRLIKFIQGLRPTPGSGPVQEQINLQIENSAKDSSKNSSSSGNSEEIADNFEVNYNLQSTPSVGQLNNRPVEVRHDYQVPVFSGLGFAVPQNPPPVPQPSQQNQQGFFGIQPQGSYQQAAPIVMSAPQQAPEPLVRSNFELQAPVYSNIQYEIHDSSKGDVPSVGIIGSPKQEHGKRHSLNNSSDLLIPRYQHKDAGGILVSLNYSKGYGFKYMGVPGTIIQQDVLEAFIDQINVALQ